MRRKILVACDRPVLSGGFLRFERMGQALAPFGHELAFVALGAPHGAQAMTSFGHRVLDFTAASAERWDAVMVPGAGFPPAIIDAFSWLRSNQFGVRVQHILNDTTLHARFLAVNRVFSPHMVIFNNSQWSPASLTAFQADQFHTLLGAVDLVRFRPMPNRWLSNQNRWMIGGQDRKNPEPLIATLDLLPETVGLCLFGSAADALTAQHTDLVASGRLQLLGCLDEAQMADFYKSVDFVVSTETYAGWSNMGAEALASGVPLICTKAGTSAFAYDLKTAILVKENDAQAIAHAVIDLMTNANLRAQLVERGRLTIEAFGWDRYANRMLAHITSILTDLGT